MYNPSVEEPNDTLLGPQNKIHSLFYKKPVYKKLAWGAQKKLGG